MASFRLLRLAFTMSVAESLLSRSGSKRGAPVCSSHASPVAAPQVVQRTEFICFTVSSLFFIQSLSSCADDGSTGKKKTSRSGYVPAENFLESLLYFFEVKQFLA